MCPDGRADLHVWHNRIPACLPPHAPAHVPTQLTIHPSLLRARAVFRLEGSLNPADYGETLCRATACEVLARRIIHKAPRHRLQSIYSTRYRYREADGDASASTCALEQAIDQHCTVSGWMQREQGD